MASLEAALLAVNLGDDADTTGAVYGQLEGGWYGEQGIPEVGSPGPVGLADDPRRW